jgi:phosphoribosyl 1,2-cyclic phosphodiesterase
VALWPDGPAPNPGPPFILDLGTGVRQLGLDLGPEPVELVAAVSHLHFDHIQGLPFFPTALVEGAVIDIYGPVPDEVSLAEGFTSVLRPPWFPLPLEKLPAELRFHELDEGDLHVGGFALRARRVPHLGATCGYRVERDGVSVAYVSDHQAPFARDAVSDAVLDLCSGADLVIHDAQFNEAEFVAKKHWGHSTVGYAVRVAHESGARRLALYHHDPTHGDDELDRLGEVARDLARRTGAGGLEVLMAAEGLTLDLGCRALRPEPGA